MADLDLLRAEAEALRDELVSHDLARDEIAQRKIAKDQELFQAENAGQIDALKAQLAELEGEPVHATVIAPPIEASMSAPIPTEG